VLCRIQDGQVSLKFRCIGYQPISPKSPDISASAVVWGFFSAAGLVAMIRRGPYEHGPPFCPPPAAHDPDMSFVLKIKISWAANAERFLGFGCLVPLTTGSIEIWSKHCVNKCGVASFALTDCVSKESSCPVYFLMLASV
jgi:hypothetical protein